MLRWWQSLAWCSLLSPPVLYGTGGDGGLLVAMYHVACTHFARFAWQISSGFVELMYAEREARLESKLAAGKTASMRILAQVRGQARC